MVQDDRQQRLTWGSSSWYASCLKHGGRDTGCGPYCRLLGYLSCITVSSSLSHLYVCFFEILLFHLTYPRHSNMSSDTYDHTHKTESVEANMEHLARLRTVGGHLDDRAQPSLPVVHRSLANPAPLGLLSFATGNAISQFTGTLR